MEEAPVVYVLVTGLPTLICMRMPPKVPQRLLNPALTQVAREFGCRQKDISGLEIVAETNGRNPRAAEAPAFHEAFSGKYRLKKFELREWDQQTNTLVKVRGCLHDRQAVFAESVGKWNDRVLFDMRIPRWALLRFARVEMFDVEACEKYFAQQERTPGFDEGAGGYYRRVVALRSRDSLEIIDGKDRVAAAVRMGNEGVQALIGDFDRSSVQVYEQRVLSIPSLKNRAGPEFTFYEHASRALGEAESDPRKVDWIGVDEAVLYESIVEHGQPSVDVVGVLMKASPSGLFPDRLEQLQARASEVNRLASRTELLNNPSPLNEGI